MFSIPETYYKNNEDYITIPAIHNFMRSHPDGHFKLNQNREELLKSILAYGSASDEQAEIVLDWLDEVLQEGIKDLYLQYAPPSEEMNILFASEQSIVAHLHAYTNNGLSHHVCKNQYGKEYKLVSAEYKTDAYGRRITFVYCRKLHMHDKKNQHTKAIDYPVIADYFLDSQWILVRAKPRSNLYEFNPDGFNIEGAKSTSTEREIKKISDSVISILGLKKKDKNYASVILKRRIFSLLDSYSKTPAEIKAVMEERKEEMAIVSGRIKEICTVPEKCYILEGKESDIADDVANIIEKYLSINWKDKSIFTKDRQAFPVRLSATDEEESKVEQTAAAEEPLQTKALFFDNKKMLYKSRQCDGVALKWKRKTTQSFAKDAFSVRIYVNPKGNCIFKFSEYTVKEDIESVVFSIIGDTQETE